MSHIYGGANDTILALQYVLLKLVHTNDHFVIARQVLEEKLKIMLVKTNADPTMNSGVFQPPIGIVVDSIRRRPAEKQRWASIVPLMLAKMSRVDRERCEGLPEYIFE